MLPFFGTFIFKCVCVSELGLLLHTGIVCEVFIYFPPNFWIYIGRPVFVFICVARMLFSCTNTKTIIIVPLPKNRNNRIHSLGLWRKRYYYYYYYYHVSSVPLGARWNCLRFIRRAAGRWNIICFCYCHEQTMTITARGRAPLDCWDPLGEDRRGRAAIMDSLEQTLSIVPLSGGKKRVRVPAGGRGQDEETGL